VPTFYFSSPTHTTEEPKKPANYPKEVRTQAVELFNKCRDEFSSKKEAAQHVADLLGIGSFYSILDWAKQAEIDGGIRAGLTSNERDEMRRLRRENAELKRANGILKAASAFFAAELDRPLSR
jgi:transposase